MASVAGASSGDQQPAAAAPAAQAPAAAGSLSLYVGNLGPDVMEQQLFDKFSTIGQIAGVRICRDSMTRRSLGYAYINYTSADHAKQAIEDLNCEIIGDRPMRVMYSQRDPSLRRSGVGNIFISGLHKDIDTKTLHDTFAKYGNILSCKISVDAKGQSRGYGFVHYMSEQEAADAIKTLNGMVLSGQQIRVIQYKTKQERNKELELNFTNVFVKHLPGNMTKEGLDALFSQFGPIARSTVRTKDGSDVGASKEYGFVEFQNHESARAAVEALNGKKLEEGRQPLIVMRAQKKAERMAAAQRNVQRFPTQAENANLYVKNLDETVTEDQLRKVFEPFGTPKSVKIAVDAQGRSRGFGFVSFETQDEATKALTNLSTKFVGSKPIYVAKFQRKSERQQQLAMQYMTLRQQQMQPYGMFPYMNMMVPAQYPFQGGRRVPSGMGPQRFPPSAMGQFPRNPSGPAGPGTFAPGARPPRPAGSFPPNVNAPGMRRAGPGGPQRRVDSSEPLTASVLASASEADQKQMIGERLYPLIHQRHGDKAAKITGMLLEMDNSELLHLLEDSSALIAKEQEALRVLQEHATTRTA